MSELLDERVVEMRFDNSDFEQNVDQSIKTINRLKNALDFEDAGDSFDNISKAAASCDLSPMEDSIEEISVKFNMLDLVAANVISNIANKVADAGVKLAKSLTLDQVAAGWTKYEQKTQAVQTIMAATGQSIDEVNDQLEKLIWFADETSYSFTDMVNNIGKFTSAGVDLDTAVKSMMGISDWAALSGAGVQQASRVMYNLSQSIGMGYVAIQDWKSVELANMATLDFKEAVIETALAMGKIVQVGDKFKAVGGKIEFTAETMRNSLKEKWFDSDVLNAALEEYSSFADQVRDYQEEHNIATAKAAIKLMEQEGYDLSTRAAQAFIKAQEAITFTQVVESVQDAVSSQLMRSFELIFGNYEQAKRLWSDLADDLWDIFASPGERFNEMLGEVLNSDYDKLVNELPDKLEFNNALYKKLYDITKANAGKEYADALFSQYDNIQDLLKNSNILGSTLETAFGSIAKDYDQEYERLLLASKNFQDKIISLKQVAIRLSGGMYGHDEETITKNLEKIGLKYEEVAEYAEIWYQLGDDYNWENAQKDFEAGLKARLEMVKDFRGQIREYLKVDDLFDSLTEWGGRDKLIGGLSNIIEFVKQFYLFISEIIDGIAHLFGRESFLSFMIDEFYKLSGAFEFAATMFEAFIDPIYDLFHGGIQDKFDKFVNGYDKWVEDAKTLDSGVIVGAFEHVPGLVERLTDFYKAHIQSLPVEVKNAIDKISGNVKDFFNKVPLNISSLEEKILGTKKQVFKIFEDGSKKITTLREGGIINEWKESLNTFADGIIPKALNGITGFLERISGFLFGYKDDTKEFKGVIVWVYDKVKAFIDLLKTIGKDAKDIFGTVFSDIKTFFTGGKYSFSDSTIWALPARLKKHFDDLKNSQAFQEIKSFFFGKKDSNGNVIKNNFFGKISRVINEFTSSKAFIGVKEFFFGNESNPEIPGVFGKIKDFVSKIGNYIDIVRTKFNEFRRWLGLDFYQYFTWNPDTKNFESHWQRIHGAIDIAKDKVAEFGQKISTTFTSIWDSSIVQSVIKFLAGDYFEGEPVSWKTMLFGNKETGELSFLEYQLERIKNTDWFVNVRDFLFGVKDNNIGINDNALNSFFKFFHTAEEYEQANVFGKIKLALQDLKVYLFGWKDASVENGKVIEGHLTPIFEKIKLITSAVLTALNTFRSWLGLDWKQITNKDGEKSWVRQAGMIDIVWNKIISITKIVTEFGKKVANVANEFRKWLGLDWEQVTLEDGTTTWVRQLGALDKVKAKFDEIRNSKAFKDITDFILGKKTIVGTDIDPLGKMVPVIERTGGLVEKTKNKIIELKNILQNTFTNVKDWFNNIVTNAGYTNIHDFIFGNDKIGLDNVFIRMKNSLHDFFLGNESKGIDNFLVRMKNTLHDFFLGNESKGIDNLFIRMKNGFNDLIANIRSTGIYEFFFGNKAIGLDNIFIRTLDKLKEKFEEIKTQHPWLQTFLDFLIRQIDRVKEFSTKIGDSLTTLFEPVKKFLFGYNEGGTSAGQDAGTKHIKGLIDNIRDFVKSIKDIDIFNTKKNHKSFLERIFDVLIGTGSFISKALHIANGLKKIFPLIMGILLVLSIDIGGFHIANPFESLVDPLKDFVESLAIIVGLFLAIPLILRLFDISKTEIFKSFAIIGMVAAFLIIVSERLTGDESNSSIKKAISDSMDSWLLIKLIESLTAFLTMVSVAIIGLMIAAKLFGTWNLIVAALAICGILLSIGLAISWIYKAATASQKITGKAQGHSLEIWGMAAILFAIGSLISTLVIAFTWLDLLTHNKKVSDFKTPLLILAGIISAVAFFIAIIAGSMAAFSSFKPIDKSVLIALGSLVGLILAMMFFSEIITIGANKNDWQTLTAAFGGMATLLLAMAGSIWIFSKITNVNWSGIGAAMAMIGGLLAILTTIVIGFSIFQKLLGIKINIKSITDLLKAICIVGAAMLPLAGIIWAVGKVKISKEAFLKSAVLASFIAGFAVEVGFLAHIAEKENIDSWNDILPMLAAIGEVAVSMIGVAVLLAIAGIFGKLINKNILGVLTAIGGITIIAMGVWGLAAIANKANIHTYDAILPMLAAIGEVAAAMVITTGLLAVAAGLGTIINSMILGVLTAIGGITILAFAVWGLAAIANKANIHTYDAILPMLAAIRKVAAAMVITTGLLVAAAFLGSLIDFMILGMVTAIGGMAILAFAVWGLAAIANKANIHTYDAILPMLAAIGEVAAAMVITSGALVLAGALGSIMILLLPGIIAAFVGFGLLISKLQALADLADDIDSGDIEKVSEFIVGIGRAFGQMIGAFIGGIGEGLTSSLPQIGENLSGFTAALQPFLNDIKAIDESHTTGAVNFMKVMATIVADEALGWIASLFENFADDKTQMAINLCNFIAALEPFLSRVSTLTEADLKGAGIFTAIMTTIIADKALGWLATLIDKFSGDQTSTATNLSSFVTALNPFLSNITQLTEAHLEGAKLFTKILKEIVKQTALNALDNIIKYFCGTTNYSLYTYNLKVIADGIISLHQKFTQNGITKDIVDTDLEIIRSVLGLVTDSQYKSGGLAGMFDSILNGKTDFKALFDKLNTDVVDGFVTFADKTKGIETADAEKAAEVLPSILNLLSGKGYRVGGLKNWFTDLFEGENSYDALFEALIGSEDKKGIIDYMSELSTKIKSLDNLQESDLLMLSNAASAIKSVFGMMAFDVNDLMAENIPKTSHMGIGISGTDYNKMVESLLLITNGSGTKPGIPDILSQMEEKLKTVDADLLKNTIGLFLDLIKMMSTVGSGNIELDTEGISEIGTYVVEGLALSLESEESTSRIKMAAINLGHAIIEGLRIGTDENSPSKAAMVVGQFVAQGLTNGLLAGEPLTWAMARQFGEGTIKALKDGAEKYAQYGLTKHAINMVTEDLKDENIFNMPDFSFVNHLGMEDIDFEKMRSFLQEKFGEVFDPTVIDGFVNSYMNEFNKLPKEIKKADYAKLMTDIAKGEYGIGQDTIIDALAEELGSVTAAEQAWEDYNNVLEGNIKINKDLLKQRKENPPMTYEDYLAMIQHEQEGIDLLNKGFFHQLAGKNGTTVEQEMANWGYNPKSTQQAIDAMYMSSEEFYKFYEDYINRKADEVEQDRLLREREKEYENLANNIKNTKEQTDELTESTDNLNHLAGNIEGTDTSGIVVVDDSGTRKAIDKADNVSKDIVDTVIENYQNGAKISQKEISQLLYSKVQDGNDPNKTIYPRLKEAGIEVQAFFDYLDQFATDNQKRGLHFALTAISDTIEDSAENIKDSAEKVSTSGTSYSSSVNKVKKIWGKSADELLETGKLTPAAIEYLETADGKAINGLINRIKDDATDLSEADKELLSAFRESVNTYGAFDNGEERKNKLTAFGISQDNYDFVYKYLNLGDKYLNQLKEEQKASKKAEDQNKNKDKSMKDSAENMANSFIAGLTGEGKEFTDFLGNAIQKAADNGLDNISFSISDLPFLSDDLKKKYEGQTIDFSFKSMGFVDKDNKPLKPKEILKEYGKDFIVTGFLGSLGFSIDDTFSGDTAEMLNAFLQNPEDIIGAFTDLSKALKEPKKNILSFFGEGAMNLFNSLLNIEDKEDEINNTTLDIKTDNKALDQTKAYLEKILEQYKLTEQEEGLVTSGYRNLSNGGVINKQQQDALIKMFNGVNVGTFGDTDAFHDYLEGLGVDWENFLTFYYKGLDEFTSNAQSYASTVKENSEYTTADLVKDIYNGKWGEGTDRQKAFEKANIDYKKAHEAYKYWLENGQDDEKLFAKYGSKRYAILTDEEAELLKQQEKFETALATTSEGAFKSIGDFLKGVNQVLSDDKTADKFNGFINSVVGNLETKTLTNAPALEQIGNFLRSVKSVSNESSTIGDSFKQAIDDIVTAINDAKLPDAEKVTALGSGIKSVADQLNDLNVEEEKINPISEFFATLNDAYTNISEMSEGSGIQGFVDKLYGALKNSKSDAAEASEEIVSTILATLDTHEADFWSRGWAFVQWISDGIRAATTLAVDAANIVASAIITAFSDAASAEGTEDSKSAMDAGKDFVSALANGIKSDESKDIISGAMHSLFGLGDEATEGLTGQTQGMISGTTGITGSIGQQLGQQFSQDFLNGFNTSLQSGEGTEGVFTSLKGMFSTLTGMGEGTYDTSGYAGNFATTFDEMAKSLKTAVQGKSGAAIEDAVGELNKKVTSKMPNGEGLGENFVLGFLQGLKNGLDKYGADIEAVAAEISNKANIGGATGIDSSSPSKTAMRLGNYFVEGFKIGLGKNHSDIYDTGYDIGNSLNEGAKDSLGIHSPSAMARYLASNYTGTFLEFLKNDIKEFRDAGYNLGDESYKGSYEALTHITTALNGMYVDSTGKLVSYKKKTAEEAAEIIKIWNGCMNGAYGVMDEFGTRNVKLIDETGHTWEELVALSDGHGHMNISDLTGESSLVSGLKENWDIKDVIDFIDKNAELVGDKRIEFVKNLGLDPKDVQNIINHRQWDGSNFNWDNYDLTTGKQKLGEEEQIQVEETAEGISQAADQLNESAKEVKVSAEELRNNIINAFPNSPGMNMVAKHAANTVSQNMASSLLNYSSSAGYHSGIKLIGGVAKGLVNGSKGKIVKKSIIDGAKQINKTFTNFEEIKSPSRIFMEYGNYMVEGLALGIENSTHYASDATETMADTISTLFSGSVSNISDLVESDLNTEPVIRPVIDMSEVESSASSIDAMLSTDKAMTISTNENEKLQNGSDGEPVFGNKYEFVQNNYSPKALSRLDIYRQTKNQFAMMKGGAIPHD